MKEDKQITDTILMVRPARFGFNEQTAANNAFQRKAEDLDTLEANRRAQAEFDAFVEKLRGRGVDVIVVEDTPSPEKPDAVFPNNWATFHQDGTIITYPMYAPLRRQERRQDVLDTLSSRYGFRRRLALEDAEAEGRYLEGTGSLVLDRPNRIAYACLSPRTDAALLERFAWQAGYEIVAFTAIDEQGRPIYHTNVMMALGDTFVVICLDSVREAHERERLLNKFAASGKALITIDHAQMAAFAGNMLQVRAKTGESYLVMSEQARLSLRPEQVKQIEQHTLILSSALDTIETLGGGSARCMMAEVFYPSM
jgi:hypothetical protein